MKIMKDARLFAVLATLICFLLSGSMATGQPQKSVAILPFTRFLDTPKDHILFCSGVEI